MRLLGFGRDNSFYELLEAQAAVAVRAAETFEEVSKDFARCDEFVDRISNIESEGDELTHQLANKIDATFVTPLDKEDLRALSGGLDDITDCIEAGMQRLSIYRLKEPRADLEPLLALLVEITQATAKMVGALREHKNRHSMQPLLIRVHELENESDRRYRQALSELFNAPNPDPLMVMKWKEIYDRIEIAVDKCEDISNSVESVVMKYA